MYEIHGNDIAYRTSIMLYDIAMYKLCCVYALHNIIYNMYYVHKEPWFIYRAMSYIIPAHTQTHTMHSIRLRSIYQRTKQEKKNTQNMSKKRAKQQRQ